MTGTYAGTDPATTIQSARDDLAEVMASDQACQEYLSAMGHMDAALRDLRVRDERIDAEVERARLEDEARANGAYDTFEDDPRDDTVHQQEPDEGEAGGEPDPGEVQES